MVAIWEEISAVPHPSYLATIIFGGLKICGLDSNRENSEY